MRAPRQRGALALLAQRLDSRGGFVTPRDVAEAVASFSSTPQEAADLKAWLAKETVGWGERQMTTGRPPNGLVPRPA